MSTRWYPLYAAGAPQLRVFLPNFWMKMVKPYTPQPPNKVQFHVSMEMTKFDVKNYLEKIYKVKVMAAQLQVSDGRYVSPHKPEGQDAYHLGKRKMRKMPDFKIAYVTLAEDEKFEFPEIFPEDKQEKMDNQQKEQGAHFKRDAIIQSNRDWDRAGTPGWFGL